MIWLLACPEPSPAPDTGPVLPERVWVEFQDLGDGFEASCHSEPQVDDAPIWRIDGELRELASDLDCDTAVACKLGGRQSEAVRPREAFARVLRTQDIEGALLCVVACGTETAEVPVSWDDGAGPLLWPQAQGGPRTCRAGETLAEFATPAQEGVYEVTLDGQPGEELGFSVAAGDLDADGAVDLVFGIPKADAPTTYAGAVATVPGVLLGRPAIPATAWDVTTGSGTADYLGWSVAVEDGVVLAGAPGDSREAHRGGSVRVLGEEQEWVGDHVLGWAGTDVALGPDGALAGAYGADEDAGAAYLLDAVGLDSPSLAGDPESWLGLAVAWVGDTDGDGLDEWAAGAPGAGRVALVDDEVRWLDGPTDGYFGWDIAGVGDHDGDGLDDVLVASPLSDEAWLGETSFDIDARSVAAAGDTDGDGRPELLLGEPGTATVWRIHSDGLRESWTRDETFGWSVAAIPDLDGDGRGELMVGDPFWSGPGADAGRVWILLGD